MGRVIGSQPHQVLAGASHDIEVVHVVTGGGHARTVVTVRDQGGVAVVNLSAQVNGTLGGAVGAVQTKAGATVGARGNLEVVDLF